MSNPLQRILDSRGGAFGTRIAEYFHLESARTLVGQARPKAPMAVTHLFSDAGMSKMTAPIPGEKALIAILHLRGVSSYQLWRRGRTNSLGIRPKGSITIVDLESEHRAFIPEPFDILQFYVPRAALDELSEEGGAAWLDSPGSNDEGIDQTMYDVGRVVVRLFDDSDATNTHFVDCLFEAVAAHLNRKYLGMQVTSPDRFGRLARWQERRCKDLMLCNIHESFSQAELAKECRLSSSHFARAFKQTVGSPPHRWLLEQRVRMAKGLLATSRESISDIALGMGFSDQSRFTRVFSRVTGATPGAWRRAGAA